MRISWRGDGHERADVAQPVRLEAGERVEVGVGEAAERHRQDVELARLDERQQQGRAARRTRRPGPGWRPRADGRRRSGRPGTRRRRRAGTGAITGMPGPPCRLVGHQLASSASCRSSPASGRAARPGAGSARRSVASSRPRPRQRADARRGRAAASGPPPTGGSTPATRQTQRPVRLAERVRDPRPDPGRRPCRRRAAARRAAPRDRSRPRRGASRRRRARGAGRRRASRRTGPAAVGEPGRQSRALRRPDRGPHVRPELADLRAPTRRLKSASRIGTRIRPPIELPGGRKKTRSSRMKPYCSRIGRHCQASRGGRNANSTFDPSSGGIGRRLKTIRTRLM